MGNMRTWRIFGAFFLLSILFIQGLPGLTIQTGAGQTGAGPMGAGLILAQGAPNDDFDSATVIASLPFNVTEGTSTATTAADDPSLPSRCSSQFNARNTNSVWFRLTAPGDGSVTVSTLGSLYDTVVAVYTGARGSLNLLDCDDDIGPGILLSQLTFGATTGTTYFIEVMQFPDPVLPGGGNLVFSATGTFGAPPTTAPTSTPVPTSTPAPSNTPTSTPAVSSTPTTTAVTSTTATRTAVPTTTQTTGGAAGKNLTIGADSSVVQLTWEPGSASAFAIARLANGTLSFPYAVLPAGTSSYADLAAPNGLDCYAVFPVGTGTQSDIMCARVGFGQLNGAPQNFRVSLNQTTTASVSWQPPSGGGQSGYVFYSDVSGLSTLSASQTSASVPTNGVTCYAVGTLVNNALTGFTNELCGLPGFTNIPPGAASSQSTHKP